ncbi:hypothetical protein FXV83_26420 [Bradyrhizobium hipponense]|uniref:Uncharacterized protein n=1 Tax=Bradyrhizobium hipponense TaxID=2605638 RepID=A0A5S4YGU9_9BRAD|nr:hypothetical protein [Bradyrhizobium hipponense]TYO63640.1 hypothetical protein FXV83_26420 [Bradyrhizobium hipponense]
MTFFQLLEANLFMGENMSRHSGFHYCVFAALTALCLQTSTARAVPKSSAGTVILGVTAYQDSEDKTQFWYLPIAMDVLLGERLKTFRATHFGIGRSYFVQAASGEVTSRAGAILSGTPDRHELGSEE